MNSDATTERTHLDKVTFIDISELPDFLGSTLEEKLKKYLQYKNAGIDIFSTAPNNKSQNGESNIKITTPTEPAGFDYITKTFTDKNLPATKHLDLDESIESFFEYIKATQDTTSKRLQGCLTSDAKLTKEIKEEIKQTEEELFGKPLSPLQTWIENGKSLVEQEIEDAEDYIEDLQDQINILQIEINKESARIENLLMLFDTISL